MSLKHKGFNWPSHFVLLYSCGMVRRHLLLSPTTHCIRTQLAEEESNVMIRRREKANTKKEACWNFAPIKDTQTHSPRKMVTWTIMLFESNWRLFYLEILYEFRKQWMTLLCIIESGPWSSMKAAPECSFNKHNGQTLLSFMFLLFNLGSQPRGHWKFGYCN